MRGVGVGCVGSGGRIDALFARFVLGGFLGGLVLAVVDVSLEELLH